MDGASQDKLSQYRTLFLQLIRNKRWNLLAVLLLVGIFCTYEYSVRSHVSTGWDAVSLNPDDHSYSEPELHVLMPAPEKSRTLDLCKAILSSTVLEYPTPLLLDWNVPWRKDIWRRGYEHNGYVRLLTTLNYLKGLKSKGDDDIVLIVDPLVTWFQLRPSVLLERYHAITKEAEHRLSKQLGRNERAGLRIQPRVLFGATKVCGCEDNHRGSACCWAVPKTPLSKDMYGRNTDTTTGHDKYSSLLPRYLDTGFVMGRAADVRAIIEMVGNKRFEAMWKVGGAAGTMNDQKVLSSLFQAQEEYRDGVAEAARQKSTNWFMALVQRLYDPFTNSKSAAAHLQTHLHPALSEKEQATSKKVYKEERPVSTLELGIHLDYYSALSQSTAHSEQDIRWLRYASLPSSLQDLSSKDCVPRHSGQLPADILRSKVPGEGLQMQLGVEERIPFPPRDWSQNTLGTDICTGSIPCTFNHNGANVDDKRLMWRWLWSSRFAQGLLKLQQRRALDMGANGEDINGVNVGGAWLNANRTTKIEWWDLCEGQGFDKDLFVT